MSGDRFAVPVAVFLILRREEEVLLLRRQNTGWCDGDYDVPAGHLEPGEHLLAGLQREAREEVGIEFAPDEAVFVHLSHALDVNADYVQAFFEVRRWSGEPRIAEPDRCDELGWFSVDDLPPNLTPATYLGLVSYLSGSLYSERTPGRGTVYRPGCGRLAPVVPVGRVTS